MGLSDDGTAPLERPERLANDRFEVPWVFSHKGRYYLLASAGSCCEGALSTYTLYVGRSDALKGPYLDSQGRDLRYGGGDVLVYRNDAWIGPGHCATITDDAGVEWLVYHAMPSSSPRTPEGTNRRQGLLDRIVWRDGWPVVNGEDGPSWTPQPAPTVR